MDSIGPYIREKILPADLSVSDAARQLGVGRPALSNLLNGKAKLSRDMALKLERTFGADANMLIRRQAELEEQTEKAATEIRAARQQAAGYLKITSTEIANWAGTIEARTHLPVLMRRLVHADVDPAAKVDFPGYDAGERKGWDGSTEVDSPGHWVPDGKAGWELSVSGDLPGKPNRDIQARSKLPASERAATTFVFVTAQNWQGKEAWIAKQRSIGQWRDVRAYDAADLEQWLERSATTQLWFARVLGRSLDGIVPIAECWRRWTESTSPKLSPLLFDEAIKERRQTLVDWIEGHGEHPFVIVADSADEALAFLARALLEADGTSGVLHDRAVLATDADALVRLAAASPDAILIAADRETELAASSLTRRNRVIVVRPRTSVENDADLTLQTPSSECFGKALEDMRVEEHLREQLSDESGLSPTILRRRLALTPELRLPSWASERALLRKLMPMLLAGAWNRTVEADRMLVAELAGKTFEEVEEDLIDLLTLPEAPVWAIGNYRGLVSRKDALFTAGAALNQDDIDRFFEVAEFILSEDDPALDLPPEERWSANIYGKKRDISGSMRAAVSELLVLFAVYGDRVLGSQVNPVGIRVDALVSRLLHAVEARKWLSQQSDLPLLAEASPRAFLEAVELDLRSDDPQLLAMMRPVKSGGFDSPDRTGLLWALEVIAWNEAYLFRVARVLARLCEVPINDNWVNKPENSMESLVRSWLPQTAANIDQRLALLDMIVREFPSVGWNLCKAQIETGHRSASPNATPRWRTDAAGAGGATYDEDYRMRRHALDLMLDWRWLDLSQLSDLISESAEMTNKDQLAVWARVQRWIDNGPSDEERAMLREHMRRSVLSRRNRKKVRTGKINGIRRSIFEALAPNDLVERHRWLFAEQWVSESGDDIWDDDFDYNKHEAHIDALRRSAIAEIREGLGFDGVGRLLSSVNAWHTVGHYLCKLTLDGERADLVATILARLQSSNERYWIGCLQGFLQALADEERDVILRALVPGLNDAAALTLFKYASFEGSTWSLLAELRPDLQVPYWREVVPYGWRQSESELNLCVERLLDVDRPISAFNAMSHEFKRLDGAILARLMKALVQPTEELEREVQINAGAVSDALDALQASGAASVAELAQYEYLFINALSHSRHGIPNLELRIEEAPADFVQLVSLLYRRDDGGEDPPELRIPKERDMQAIGSNVYRVLDKIKRTPGTQDDGTVDSSALLAWLVDVRERLRLVGRANVGDSQIGQLLGRTGPGADGIWPNEAVRDALEACGSDRMIRGMEIGLHNNRGATWRGPGGGQERNLASKYRAFSRQLQVDYPITSRMLEQVAQSYDGQAEWHDTDEAVRKRLRRR